MAARARRILAALALVAAVAPLGVALVAAHHDGWRPLGDDAVIAVLTHDVPTVRTPLLGMPSTLTANNDPHRSHHPGPMEFWTLAPLERAFDSNPIGILLGVALVNAAAIVVIGFVLLRVAGAGTAVTGLALCSVLAWAIGRQSVVDPWNPYQALFPMLATCVLTWAAVDGRRYALCGVALAASYVAQAHLLFVPLAAALLAIATLGAGASMVRRRRAGTLISREMWFTGGGTLAILAVAWSLPIYDQLAHTPGNFTAIWRSVKAGSDKQIGAGYALRVMVQAIGAPPLFLRRDDSIRIVGPPWSHLGAFRIATAIVVLAVLVATTVIAFRHRDRVAAAGGVVACVVLAVTTLVIAHLPVTFPGIPEYRLLQCWVVAGFVWLVTGWAVVRLLAPRLAQLPRPTMSAVRVAALVPIVVVLASAPIAIAYANSEGRDDPRLYRATARLASGIAAHVDTRRTYLLDIRGDQGLQGLGVGYGIYRELTRRGMHLGVPAYDYYLARSHQAPSGAPHLVLATGRVAVDRMRRSHDRLLVGFALTTAADDALLRTRTDALRASLRRRGNLTAKGHAALATGAPAADAAALRGLFDGSLDPIALLTDGRLGRLWATGLLRSNLFTTREYTQYDAARYTVDNLVFAAYLEPSG